MSKDRRNLLETAREVSFLPMEAIGEQGQLDLSATKDIEEVRNGYTLLFDGDVAVAKITPCFENGKGAFVSGLRNGLGFGTTELHVLTPGTEIEPRFLYYVTASEPFRRKGEAEMKGAAGQKRVPEDFIRDYRVEYPLREEQYAIANFLDRETSRIDALIAAKERLLELLAEKRRALVTHAVTKGLNPNAPMRDSGLPWLGEIPRHWEVKKLKRVADLRSGENITADGIDETGEYPVYGGNGLRGYTSSFTHEGDFILIGRQGALCGNINYASGKLFASEHAIVVTLFDKHDVFWLGELLRTMNLGQYSESAAQPGLSVDEIKNLDIPVPPANEQTAISRHLRNRLERFDRLAAATNRSILLLRERRSALIAAAVTGKIEVLSDSMNKIGEA